MATPTPGATFVVWLIVLVAVGFVMMLLFNAAVWWGEHVKSYADNMSSAESSTPQFRASSLGTDGPSDGRTPQPAKPSAEQLFTLYRLMREYGIKRDEAAAALRVANLPLSNDVWRRAEPPPQVPAPSDDDDVLVTPYAGRRTRASYYPDDPELEFQSPA